MIPKLLLVRNGDVAEVSAFMWIDGVPKRYDHLPTNTEVFLMATNCGEGFYLNLDHLRCKFFLLTIPQIFLHEWLHWFFPTAEVTALIHRIRKRTRGLIV